MPNIFLSIIFSSTKRYDLVFGVLEENGFLFKHYHSLSIELIDIGLAIVIYSCIESMCLISIYHVFNLVLTLNIQPREEQYRAESETE